MIEQPRPQIDLRRDGTPIKCEKCDSTTFEQAFYLFKVSRLITMEAQDTVAPVPTFKCTECGHVNSEFSIEIPEVVSQPSIGGDYFPG
jgi:uncharacterized Zn finger protein